MKKVIALALIGAVFAAGSAFAADPIIGTWKLDAAKSKFTPGPAPKAMTRVYSESGGLYTLDSKTTGADGKETSAQVQYRDGAEVKTSSAGAIDATSAKKVDANTWDFDVKSGGKTVGHVHRVVSADGKTLTVHQTGQGLSGATGDETMVFTKQ